MPVSRSSVSGSLATEIKQSLGDGFAIIGGAGGFRIAPRAGSGPRREQHSAADLFHFVMCERSQRTPVWPITRACGMCGRGCRARLPIGDAASPRAKHCGRFSNASPALAGFARRIQDAAFHIAEFPEVETGAGPPRFWRRCFETRKSFQRRGSAVFEYRQVARQWGIYCREVGTFQRLRRLPAILMPSITRSFPDSCGERQGSC